MKCPPSPPPQPTPEFVVEPNQERNFEIFDDRWGIPLRGLGVPGLEALDRRRRKSDDGEENARRYITIWEGLEVR